MKYKKANLVFKKSETINSEELLLYASNHVVYLNLREE
jgi:hypothetical protein